MAHYQILPRPRDKMPSHSDSRFPTISIELSMPANLLLPRLRVSTSPSIDIRVASPALFQNSMLSLNHPLVIPHLPLKQDLLKLHAEERPSREQREPHVSLYMVHALSPQLLPQLSALASEAAKSPSQAKFCPRQILTPRPQLPIRIGNLHRHRHFLCLPLA